MTYQQLQNSSMGSAAAANQQMYGNYQSTQSFIPQRYSMNEPATSTLNSLAQTMLELQQQHNQQQDHGILSPNLMGNVQNRSQSFNYQTQPSADQNNFWLEAKPWIPGAGSAQNMMGL